MDMCIYINDVEINKPNLYLPTYSPCLTIHTLHVYPPTTVHQQCMAVPLPQTTQQHRHTDSDP